MLSSPPILIIGAGVIGLSTATLLQACYPDVPITILAAELPTASPMSQEHANNSSSSSKASVDYASMWAGAHYRPIPRSTRQLVEEADLAMRTANIMKEIARQMPKESGVEIVPAEEYLEVPPQANLVLKSGDVYAWEGDSFQVLSEEELSSLGDGRVKWGCKYTAWVLNVHIYCHWLLSNFKANGGQVVQRRLEKLEDAFEQKDLVGMAGPSPIVVNCSGRNFNTDSKMQVIRGQTVLVRNRYHKTVTRQNADGSWAFLIPRPIGGGTVVGGTKEIGDMESAPRENSRRVLLEQAVRYFPDFVSKVEDFQVVTDNVGRRPWREGGLRMEIEELNSGYVVHGYGAGGRGYELSWGAAQKLVALVQQCTEGLRAKL